MQTGQAHIEFISSIESGYQRDEEPGATEVAAKKKRKNEVVQYNQELSRLKDARIPTHAISPVNHHLVVHATVRCVAPQTP